MMETAGLQNPHPKSITKKIVDRDVTLLDLLTDWLCYEAQEQVREQTLLTYSGYARKWIILFFTENYPDLKASDITPWIMQTFVNFLKDKGLAVSSIKKYLVPLRNATFYGYERRILLCDPLANYQYETKKKGKKKKAEAKRKAYSKANCIALMKAIEKDPNKPVVVPLMLALHLGLRREEILGLRWSDVDFENGIVTVQNTITKVYAVVEEDTKSETSMREIPFDENMGRFLRYIKRKQEEREILLGDEYKYTGYVYVQTNGKKYYPDVVTKQRKRFLAKHNLAYVDLHGLRHTYCTMLIAAGVDAKTVQQLMGRSYPRMTTKLYAHKVDEKVLATRGTVANYLEEVA